MTTALFAPGPRLLAPLQGLFRWFAAGMAPGSSRARPATSRARAPACAAPARPVLRVMRVLEAGQAPANVGRMVISGRMADVCAELDRLAAREALLH